MTQKLRAKQCHSKQSNRKCMRVVHSSDSDHQRWLGTRLFCVFFLEREKQKPLFISMLSTFVCIINASILHPLELPKFKITHNVSTFDDNYRGWLPCCCFWNQRSIKCKRLDIWYDAHTFSSAINLYHSCRWFGNVPLNIRNNDISRLVISNQAKLFY